MSFGFGVGDFLAVIELANKVRQKWKDAPEEYDTMKDETKNVTVLLENVHKLSQQGSLSDEHVKQVKESSAHCRKVLERCDSLADKFTSTAAGQASMKSRLKRLSLDPSDVRAARDQLVSCVSSLNALLTAIQSLQVSKISRGVDSMHDRETQKLISTIADWYSSDSFGLWVIKDPAYEKWQDGDTMTLLCPGIPGSGKSILHAALVQHLRTHYEHDDSVVVAYFYCSFQRQQEQTIRNILSVLVRQMFQEQRHLSPDMKALYDKHCHRKTTPSIDELEQLLHSLARGYRTVFILLDAIDEYTSDESDCIEVLDKIFEIQRSEKAMKLLVTTRWLPYIVEHFEICPQLEIRAHQEDIERFLDHNIPRLPVKPQAKIKLDNKTVTVQDAVKTYITDAADGMFLLAKLQFDSLTDKTNPRKLQQALLQLKSGSGALELEYDKALMRIDQQREGFREVAYKVLSWMVYTWRELYIDELQEAVAIYEGMDSIDHDTDLEEEQQLASVCAGLVRVDKKAGMMRLAHYTTQEYLKRLLPRRSEGEISVAKDCLIYLSMDVFADRQKDALQDLLHKYKLFTYAVREFGRHVKSEFEQDLAPYIDGLILSPELLRTITHYLFEIAHPTFEDNILLALNVGNIHFSSPEHAFDISPAHVCAYFGMASTILRIVHQGGAIDDKDSKGQTPLSWAVEWGETKVAKVLSEQSGVDIDTRDNNGQTPLSTAIRYGRSDIVEILLQRADVNKFSLTDGLAMSPLYLAVYKGRADIVRLLLQQKGVSAKSPWNDDRPVLLEAVSCGNIDIAKLLLDRPESFVSQSTSGSEIVGTSNLHNLAVPSQATRTQTSDILEMLLKHSHSRDHSSSFGEVDLLHYAATFGTAAGMEYMLSLTNASPDVEDSKDQTLLSKAVSCGQRAIVDFLSTHPDVRADSSDHNGRTPLSHAAELGNEGIVQILLKQSTVQLNSQDHHGRTPLSYAAQAGSYKALQILLDQPTIQLDSKDQQGRTPLSYAAEDCRSTYVQAFLERSEVDMDASDDNGITPFLWAVKQHDLEVAGLFLSQWLMRSKSGEAYSVFVLKAIQDICRVFKDTWTNYNPFLDFLSRCLLRMGYEDLTLFAYQQEVTTAQDTSMTTHAGVQCDGCGICPIVGKRYVCKTCVDGDVCSACRDADIYGQRVKDSSNHDFLEVPGKQSLAETLESLDRACKSLQDQKIASKRQAESDLGAASSGAWRVAIEEQYRYWGILADS